QPEHYVQGGRAGERVWLEATVLTLGLQPMTPPFLFMRPELVSRHSGSRHNSRAGHPGWLRCSSLRYSRYPRSSRLAIRAPRSGTYATIHCDGTLDIELGTLNFELFQLSGHGSRTTGVHVRLLAMLAQVHAEAL